MLESSLDLVVGICTKNCADTISRVVETVDRGLVQFFPDNRSLIVVSDGFSTDGTRENALATKTTQDVIVTPQTGQPGKGNGVRTILEIARNRAAAAVALVDGDLTSIEADWIYRLAGPVLAGKDLVVPYYFRHHCDGVITNQIAFPLTNVLFGVGVRQPIGGEYGISVSLLESLVQHELFPAGFGIDIFITLVAISERMKIVEAVLGVKEHESTKQYADPDRLLVPMFYQVVGTLFELIGYYREYIATVCGMKPVERLGESRHKRPRRIATDQEDLIRRFRDRYREMAKEGVPFLAALKENLDRVASKKLSEFSFPLSVWVKAVYLAINEYARSHDPKVLDALRVLWQGRFLSLVRETQGMSEDEAERVIQGQLDAFQQQRSILSI